MTARRSRSFIIESTVRVPNEEMSMGMLSRQQVGQKLRRGQLMIRSKQTASQANTLYVSTLYKYAHLCVSSANHTKKLVETLTSKAFPNGDFL